MSYTAFVIDDVDRRRLLERYKPIFPDVIAHHVTFKMGEHSELLEYKPLITIYAELHNHNIQALLVTVDGRPTRPDGGKYHITWSLDRSQGVKPVDSNKLIEQEWDDKLILVPCIVSGQIQICK